MLIINYLVLRHIAVSAIYIYQKTIMKEYKGLPIYQGLVDDEGAGMYCISLVAYAATEENFLYFNEDKTPLKFAIQNPEKHIVRGLLMGCGQPIYRRNGDYEFYITFNAETLALMAEKYLKNGFSSMVDLNHDGQPVDGVNMTQIFIKNTEEGINPKGFEDYKDGSLFVEFKVHNEEVWNAIKDGDFKGFSLAGAFEIAEIPTEFSAQSEDDEFAACMQLIEKLTNKIKNVK